MSRWMLVIFCTMGLAEVASAGFMIEPYLGYEVGNRKISYTDTTTTTEGSLSGAAFGARLGYKFLLVWVAADYSSGAGKLNPSNGGIDTDTAQTALGLTVGVDVPLGLRIFGGYGSSYEMKEKSTSSEVKFQGAYTKLGLGFSLIPMVALNVEYKMLQPTRYIAADGTSMDFSAASINKFTYNPIFVSLSILF